MTRAHSKKMVSIGSNLDNPLADLHNKHEENKYDDIGEDLGILPDDYVDKFYGTNAVSDTARFPSFINFSSDKKSDLFPGFISKYGVKPSMMKPLFTSRGPFSFTNMKSNG
jgi:hypothetical protein